MAGIKIHVSTGLVFLLSTNLIISDCSNHKWNKEDHEICRNRTDGYHVYRGDCGKYIWCLEMKGYVLRCPPGLYYNRFQKVCMLPHLSKCATMPTNNLYRSVKFRGLFIENKACKRIVCNYHNGAQYRSEAARFLPKDIDAFVCTHIVYFSIGLIKYELVMKDLHEVESVKEIMDKKKSNPNLKVLGAVGTWSTSKLFPQLAASSSSRQTFIKSCIQFLRKYDFDGLSIAWLYPGQTTNGSPIDKFRFTTFLKEIRQAFDLEVVPLGKSRLVLSASVAGSVSRIRQCYEVDKIHQYLDFLSVMSYDYSRYWLRKTGHSSPLSTVKKGVEYWSNHGTPNHKVVLGLPSYGRSFTLLDKQNIGLGAPASMGGRGEYTNSKGLLSYMEICKLQWKKGVVKYILDTTDSYIVSGDQWIAYDDESSFWIKVQYMRAGLFGGVMISDMSYDDFRGSFCFDGKYPLLNTIKQACEDY